ncbi:MAG: galactokinase [Cellulosilyticaceae bacterium]
MNLETMQSTFKQVFNHEHEAAFFAPGRINLIGEHIDYNGGLVFPCPITLGTYALVSKREDSKICAYSMNFKHLGVIEFDLNNLEYDKAHNWVNYVKGVAKFLKEDFTGINHGLNIVVFGNIPNGSGLSSSASLEMLAAVIFKDTFGLELNAVDAALLGKKVENLYIGVNSGIMDQFAISLGKKDSAILLNCDTLDFSYFSLSLPAHSIIIMNTNKRRELADSKYNERRGECESSLAKLQTVITANNLCEVTMEQLEAHKDLLTEVEYRRSRHVITENIRVKEATACFEANDLVGFGKLLNGSHTSLRDDYEVTGIELDTLAETAWAQEGVLGARMTGAGFGGCGLAIVENEEVDAFIENVGDIYFEKIGYEASFYIASIGNGPTQLN